MPITAEQARTELRRRQALAELRRRGIEPNVPIKSIVGDAGGLAGQNTAQDSQIESLFEQLGGRMPTEQPFPIRPREIGARVGIDIGEIERRKAFDDLIQIGFSPQQIEMSLKARKVLGGPRIGRTAGGIGGAIGATAIAGRLIPGPIDDAAILAALVAAGGAGLGGIGGEAAQIAIEEKRLIGKGEALKAFAIEAGTELGARGAVRTGKFLLSPFIKKTIPEAASLVDDFAKVGGNFSPTEIDKRFSIWVGEAFSRGSFGAKEIFQEFEERQGKAAFAFADAIIDNIAKGIARQTPEEIGDAFAKGITKPGGRIFNLLDDLFTPLYSQLDETIKGSSFGLRKVRKGGKAVRGVSGRFIPARELQRIRIGAGASKGAGVSTKSLKAFRNNIIAQNKRLVAITKRTGKDLPLVSPAGIRLLDDIDNLPEYTRHADYRAFRSKVLKETRKLNRDVDISEGMVKQISDITRRELLDPKSVSNLPREVQILHSNISNLFAASRKGLEATFPESLAKRLLKNPSRIVKEVFPNKNPKAIRLLRESLVEPISGKPSAEGKVMWNQLRQAWLADAVSEATKEGVVKPRTYNNILRKLGREAFEEMYPEKVIRTEVDKIQSLFEIAGKAPPSGTSLFSRSAQIGGLALMYRSGKEDDFIGFTAGAALAIGPLAFAKLATNPQGVKYLTAGFKMKPGASGLVPLVVRMTRLLRGINERENKQRQAALRRMLQQERAPRVLSTQLQRGFGGRRF